MNLSFSVTSIACGNNYSWFITEEKVILLGFGNPNMQEQDTSTVDGVIIQAAARHNTMALLSDTGKVYTFSKSTEKFFLSTSYQEKFTFVACGETHTLALDAAGNVFSWGNNNYYKLGRIDSQHKLCYISRAAKQVAAGSNHSFVLLQTE